MAGPTSRLGIPSRCWGSASADQGSPEAAPYRTEPTVRSLLPTPSFPRPPPEGGVRSRAAWPRWKIDRPMGDTRISGGLFPTLNPVQWWISSITSPWPLASAHSIGVLDGSGRQSGLRVSFMYCLYRQTIGRSLKGIEASVCAAGFTPRIHCDEEPLLSPPYGGGG